MSPQAPGVPEFHSGILVTELSPGTGSPRLFSPGTGTVPDPLVKGEQTPAVGPSECPQVTPAPGILHGH